MNCAFKKPNPKWPNVNLLFEAGRVEGGKPCSFEIEICFVETLNQNNRQNGKNMLRRSTVNNKYVMSLSHMLKKKTSFERVLKLLKNHNF